MFAVLIPAALAGSATSPNGYYTVFGVEYYNYSTVSPYADGAHAATHVRTVDGRDVPAGYVGYQLRLFNEAGKLVYSTDPGYSSGSSSGIGGISNRQYVSKGAYYSQGMTAGYNGNGYDLTFGQIGLDLIKAVGVDGTEGHVYESDLKGPMPKTPEEALAMQEARKRSKSAGRFISLYKEDGVTVIGEFLLAPVVPVLRSLHHNS